jgi:nucleotide-binding universal stress UspA family protein
VRDWLFGSVAQQVIAQRRAPVLLIQPSVSDAVPPFACRHLLVPLDGDPEHEQGLAVAAGLAEPCQAEIYLVCIVPTRSTLSGERAASAMLLPTAAAAALELDEAGARRYLKHQVDLLEEQGLWATTEVRRGDPTSAIVQAAKETRADMILLGTHGKAGMNAFWSESVAPRVCSRARLPLLLVPVEGR